MPDRDNDVADNKEIIEVDMSRILQYVSPLQLEDFENDQFRIEAAAEAEVLRQEAEELARWRMEKEAGVSGRGRGRGRGSRMLSGLGLVPDAPRGGRPRARGSGRGRGRWRGRTSRILSPDTNSQQDVTGNQAEESNFEEDVQHEIAETDAEEYYSEDEKQVQASPSIMRSAFVANSALNIQSTSPMRHRFKQSFFHGDLVEVSDTECSESMVDDSDTKRISSAAMHLRLEDASEDGRVGDAEMEDFSDHGHLSKRRRTESTTSKSPVRRGPNPASKFSYSHPSHVMDDSSRYAFDEVEDSDKSSGKSISAASQSRRPHSPTYSAQHSTHLDNINVLSVEASPLPDEEDDEEAEEYIVEAILEHYYDQGKKYYLVKWEGYEDSHDWLPAQDLEGAAELVEEYDKRTKKQKMKMKEVMK